MSPPGPDKEIEIISEQFTHYDSIDEDLRAEIPLKRIWAVASQDKE